MSLFGWWRPECPVGFREKAWVEMRMRWLGEQFGSQRLSRRCRMILPTDEFFPDRFDETPDTARRLLDRVCLYMEVPPSQIELRIQPKDDMVGAVGLYEPGVIHVADSQLLNPMALVATFAHELAHHLLRQQTRLDDAPDRELVTDLTTVVFGLGIFIANATVADRNSHAGTWHWWSISRLGYLPSRATAYAMALHAWLRGDLRPDWVAYLRPDAAEALSKGLRYLCKTEDSMLRPDNLSRSDKTLSPYRQIERLQGRSASERVATLWELAGQDSPSAATVKAVADCLRDHRPGIRAEAARTLSAWGPAADASVPELVDELGDGEVEVRAAAAYALGRLRLRPEAAVPELIDRLGDSETLDAVAWALAQFGPAAAMALPRLLDRLKSELGRMGAVDYLAYAIRAISPDPEAELHRLIDSCDSESQPLAQALLPESGPIANPPGSSGWPYWAGLA